jgi:hypothetical protein
MSKTHGFSAGLAEGEGSWFMHRGVTPYFKLGSTDEDIVQRFAREMGLTCHLDKRPAQQAQGYKPFYTCNAQKLDDVQRVTTLLSPWLGHRRRAKIVELGLTVEPIQERRLAWLAGYLEGEACFTARNGGISPRIVVEATDNDVIRVAHYLSLSASSIQERPPRRLGYKPVWRFVVCGQPAATLMENILPIMGERRNEKINQILGDWYATST